MHWPYRFLSPRKVSVACFSSLTSIALLLFLIFLNGCTTPVRTGEVKRTPEGELVQLRQTDELSEAEKAKFRQNLIIVFIISILVNVGMWFERFVIVVGSLYQDFVPSSWGHYAPTWVDVCTFLGTFGLFFTMFLLFIRFLPLIAISEVKGVMPHANPHHPLGGAKLKREHT